MLFVYLHVMKYSTINYVLFILSFGFLTRNFYLNFAWFMCNVRNIDNFYNVYNFGNKTNNASNELITVTLKLDGTFGFAKLC